MLITSQQVSFSGGAAGWTMNDYTQVQFNVTNSNMNSFFSDSWIIRILYTNNDDGQNYEKYVIRRQGQLTAPGELEDVANLYIPDETEEEKEKCASPTIIYANGTLTFACETKDAKIEYNYTISANGSGTAESGGVKPKFTLTVKAWANAEGYDTSDTVTVTFESSDTGSGNKGDVNEDGAVDISDVVKVINIIAGEE